MNISYDYYRIFYYVAKYESVSRAAKFLYSNQPNVTRTIKNLETQLGCTLFSRSSRGMKLTPEGKKLYSHIKIAFEHITAGEKEIISDKDLKSGTVFVAASEVALRCHLLPVLKKFRTRYPDIRVKVSSSVTTQAIEEVKSGESELAIVTTPTVKSPSLEQIKIKDICEVPVCSDDFDALTKDRIPLKVLQNYPLISMNEQTKTYEFYAEYFSNHGVEFSPDIEAATADQILPMVKMGIGIGFVPREFLSGNNNGDNVNEISINEELPRRSICLIKRRDQPLGVAARELERLILAK